LQEIDFQKFASYGYYFVIVDEAHSTQLPEDEKSHFVGQATDVTFGMYADGVIFLQSYRSDVLVENNDTRRYRDSLPDYPQLDFIFRIFEPNGSESFSCGNGLMCLASFLNRRYNVAATQI
jgi:diaminopimelate epimerase